MKSHIQVKEAETTLPVEKGPHSYLPALCHTVALPATGNCQYRDTLPSCFSLRPILDLSHPGLYEDRLGRISYITLKTPMLRIFCGLPPQTETLPEPQNSHR